MVFLSVVTSECCSTNSNVLREFVAVEGVAVLTHRSRRVFGGTRECRVLYGVVCEWRGLVAGGRSDKVLW